MPILIDGYNLLYALGRLTPRSRHPALDAARRWLLQQLNTSPRRADMTVVFDGQSSLRHEEMHGHVHVVYSEKVSADDVIEELIRTSGTPRGLVVVSNDNRLKHAAQRAGGRALDCLDFFEQLQAPPAPPLVETDPSPGKPETVTPEEAAVWLREFGELDDDSF